jgi:hypothetical protein
MVKDHVEPEVERKIDEKRTHCPCDEVVPGKDTMFHMALLRPRQADSRRTQFNESLASYFLFLMIAHRNPALKT